ncbi:kinase-like domain-containing protein [Flammula alnicola]|nr:kinase-like domain-containing protein [Flammula alnicola]
MQHFSPEHDLSPLAAQSLELHKDALPFTQTHYSDLYIGYLAKEKVIVKSWRAIGMNQGEQRKFTERLSRELNKWHRTVSHSNISAFFGLSEPLTQRISKIPSLVLPYYQNGNATEYLKRHSTASALHLLVGVASALSFLHSQSPPITHGKLQGSNILISDAGEPLLTDIGMRNLPYPQDLTMASTHESLQEVRWMAPELIDPPPTSTPVAVHSQTGDENVYCVSTQSDVHSFAMTVLELMTLKPPFAHRRHAYRVIMDLTSGVRPPRPVGPYEKREMTDEVWELLGKCWAHDPAARPDMEIVVGWVGVLELQGRLSMSLAVD